MMMDDGEKELKIVMDDEASQSNDQDLSNKDGEKYQGALKITRIKNRRYIRMPNFPKRAVSTLKAWLNEHLDNPYPTYKEKEYLSKESGLSKRQIQNWFTNARKRIWQPLVKVQENSTKVSNINIGPDMIEHTQIQINQEYQRFQENSKNEEQKQQHLYHGQIQKDPYPNKMSQMGLYDFPSQDQNQLSFQQNLKGPYVMFCMPQTPANSQKISTSSFAPNFQARQSSQMIPQQEYDKMSSPFFNPTNFFGLPQSLNIYKSGPQINQMNCQISSNNFQIPLQQTHQSNMHLSSTQQPHSDIIVPNVLRPRANYQFNGLQTPLARIPMQNYAAAGQAISQAGHLNQPSSYLNMYQNVNCLDANTQGRQQDASQFQNIFNSNIHLNHSKFSHQ